MDPIADMLTRITNAQAVRHERVSVPFSNVKFTIAKLLESKGYLSGVERKKRPGRAGKTVKAEVEYLDLALKYLPADKAGGVTLGAISGIRLLSRPSRHLYIKASQIKPIRSGYGTLVVSTPKGILAGADARKEKVGGELMFEIW